jgi:UDP-N-acetylglucosamine acyltransferase
VIHPNALVDRSAKVADNVEIGPFTVIGPDVEIGEGTWIGPHVVIRGPTRIGRDNRIFQFSSIGECPQDKKFQGELTYLEIGDRNVIRECCTFNRGTAQDRTITKIGNDNLFMAYVHIAHDCIVGNHITFANNASLAGHATIEDYVTLGGFSGVAQRCRMGAFSFASMGALINKDVPPYVKVAEYYARPYGLNTVGLERRGFTSDTILQLKRAYKVIYRQGLTAKDAVATLQTWGIPEVDHLIEFIKNSKVGIIR